MLQQPGKLGAQEDGWFSVDGIVSGNVCGRSCKGWWSCVRSTGHDKLNTLLLLTDTSQHHIPSGWFRVQAIMPWVLHGFLWGYPVVLVIINIAFGGLNLRILLQAVLVWAHIFRCTWLVKIRILIRILHHNLLPLQTPQLVSETHELFEGFLANFIFTWKVRQRRPPLPNRDQLKPRNQLFHLHPQSPWTRQVLLPELLLAYLQSRGLGSACSFWRRKDGEKRLRRNIESLQLLGNLQGSPNRIIGWIPLWFKEGTVLEVLPTTRTIREEFSRLVFPSSGHIVDFFAGCLPKFNIGYQPRWQLEQQQWSR